MVKVVLKNIQILNMYITTGKAENLGGSKNMLPAILEVMLGLDILR
jgi:hypothetical protein